MCIFNRTVLSLALFLPYHWYQLNLSYTKQILSLQLCWHNWIKFYRNHNYFTKFHAEVIDVVLKKEYSSIIPPSLPPPLSLSLSLSRARARAFSEIYIMHLLLKYQ